MHETLRTRSQSVLRHFMPNTHSRRELVANSCTHRRRRRDATKQFRRVGVGGVYWALVIDSLRP